MEKEMTFPEGTQVIKDILGEEWKILPNGIAIGKHGELNLSDEKYYFMQSMGYAVNSMYQANTSIWELNADGTACWTLLHSIEIYARGLATKTIVKQEWLDEILANNTPLENITRYLVENDG